MLSYENTCNLSITEEVHPFHTQCAVQEAYVHINKLKHTVTMVIQPTQK